MHTRRALLQSFALTPLAVTLADPGLARAAAEAALPVSLNLANGDTVAGALASPQGEPRALVMLIHEWWGLNDQIKTVAAAFADEGYAALAVDLYGGEVATTREQARALMNRVEQQEATQTLVAWADWLKAEHPGKKLGTVGWCFGGGWSLSMSLATPVDATVVYYGNVAREAPGLSALKGPVLGHFATQDQWINQAMVDGFEAAMNEAAKPYTSHWYDAMHGFANPTTARYDQQDAALAWERTLAFFARHLGE